MISVPYKINSLDEKVYEEILTRIERSEEKYLSKENAVEIAKEKLNRSETLYKNSKEEILKFLDISEEKFLSVLVDQVSEENEDLINIILDKIILEDSDNDEIEFNSGFPTKIVTGVYKLVLYENGKYEIIAQEEDYMFDELDFDYDIF